MDTSELTTIRERDVVEVDLADIDQWDLDEVSETTEIWIHKAHLILFLDRQSWKMSEDSTQTEGCAQTEDGT